MKPSPLFSCKDWLFILLFLVLFVLVFKEFLFTDGTFFERDSTLLEIPSRQLCVELLKEGNFALWTDAYGNGQPFLANPKNAVLYPGTWLYLLFPFFFAFKFHYVVHFVLCWIGIYYLCKSYSLSEQASFLGASAFLFSGVYLSSLEFYNHIAALCWMPWILLVLLRFGKRSFPRLIILAGFWSLMILAGTPYVIIVTGCFALVQTLLVRDMRKKRLLMLVLSVVLALALTAAQLIPTIDLYRSSAREEGTSAIWSLEPLQLFNFVFPHFLGNDRQPGHNDYWGDHLFEKGAPLFYSLFMGIGFFVLAFFGLKRPLDYRNYLYIFLAFFFFILALGNRTPLYALWKFLPPFSAIRYPVKYLLPFAFCVAILSALGFDRLFRDEGRGEKKSIFIVVISTALLVLFFAVKGPLLEIFSGFFVIDKSSSVSELSNSLFSGLFFLWVCAVLVCLSRFVLTRKKTLSWILLGVVVIYPLSINRFINPVMPISTLTKPLVLEEKPGQTSDSVKVYRDGYKPFAFKEEVGGTEGMYHYLRESLMPYYGLLFEVNYVFSRDFFNIYGKDMNASIAALEEASPENKVKLLRSVGCDFILTHFALPLPQSERVEIEGYEVFKQDIPRPLPDAFLVYDYRLAKTFDERMAIFQRTEFDPGVSAIVDRNLPIREIQDESEEASVRAVERLQSRQRYQVANGQSALLVLQGNHSRGWKAWVNGEQTEILEANLSAKAIFLPAGTHEVIIKYCPKSFQVGAAISLVVLIFMSGIPTYFFIKRIFTGEKAL